MKKLILFYLFGLLFALPGCDYERMTDTPPHGPEKGPQPEMTLAEAKADPGGYKNGHSFLLEGAMVRERKIRFVDGKYHVYLGVRRETLVYVNYGWKGSHNGYYQAGVFDTNAGPVSRSGTEGNFQYNMQMVYGVRI